MLSPNENDWVSYEKFNQTANIPKVAERDAAEIMVEEFSRQREDLYKKKEILEVDHQVTVDEFLKRKNSLDARIQMLNRALGDAEKTAPPPLRY
jgi:hypothetical protein